MNGTQILRSSILTLKTYGFKQQLSNATRSILGPHEHPCASFKTSSSRRVADTRCLLSTSTGRASASGFCPPSAATSGFLSREHSLHCSTPPRPNQQVRSFSVRRYDGLHIIYPYADARCLEDSRTQIITFKFHFQFLTFPHNFGDIS